MSASEHLHASFQRGRQSKRQVHSLVGDGKDQIHGDFGPISGTKLHAKRLKATRRSDIKGTKFDKSKTRNGGVSNGKLPLAGEAVLERDFKERTQKFPLN